MTATLEQIIDIDASPSTVYAMWTTAPGLYTWWGASAEVDARPGGLIRVDLGGPAVMSGTFVELDPPRRVVFTFGWEHPTPDGPLPPGSTTVEVDIAETASGCRLTLRHHGLPTRHRATHVQGWSHFLGKLQQNGTSP